VEYDGENTRHLGIVAEQWNDRRMDRVVDKNYWLIPTSTRVKGRNRVCNKKTNRIEDPEGDVLENLLPRMDQIVCCRDDIVLSLAIYHYLGNWHGEGPVPENRCFAHRKRIVKDGVVFQNFTFAFKDKVGEWVPLPPCDNFYECKSECIDDGILRYLADQHRQKLSEVVFGYVESEAGREQSNLRDFAFDRTGKRKSNLDIRCQYYIFYTKKEAM
jgi:hypothetical protein